MNRKLNGNDSRRLFFDCCNHHDLAIIADHLRSKGIKSIKKNDASMWVCVYVAKDFVPEKIIEEVGNKLKEKELVLFGPNPLITYDVKI